VKPFVPVAVLTFVIVLMFAIYAFIAPRYEAVGK